MKTKLVVVALSLFACSCSTAGPFITNISSDGKGNLVIEKSMVRMNAFTGTVSNTEPTTSTIRLYQPGDGARR